MLRMSCILMSVTKRRLHCWVQYQEAGKHALGDPKLSTVTLCNELKMAIRARTSTGGEEDKWKIGRERLGWWGGMSSVLHQRLVSAAAGRYVHHVWMERTCSVSRYLLQFSTSDSKNQATPWGNRFISSYPIQQHRRLALQNTRAMKWNFVLHSLQIRMHFFHGTANKHGHFVSDIGGLK